MSKKLGVLIAGLNGAVGNTTVSGSIVASSGKYPLLGMLTETSRFRGIDFTKLEDFTFGGWDLNDKSAMDQAKLYKIIPQSFLKESASYLKKIIPMKGVVGKPDYYFGRKNSWEKRCSSLSECLKELQSDIARFKSETAVDRCYVVNLTSPPKAVIEKTSNINKYELMQLVDRNSELISAPVLYALAAINTRSGFVDFTSSQTLEIRGLVEMSNEQRVPLAGRDGATGETALKASLAEFFQKRNFRVSGWFSTNILGNNDGLVLENKEHGKLKFSDKMELLPEVLGYLDFDNIVRINYYSPRGDNKEAWDVIDFSGWLGLDMSLRVNLWGRDSILAAPLLLDILRHMEYARTKGDFGLLGHLGLYFKHPMGNTPKAFSESFQELSSYYEKRV